MRRCTLYALCAAALVTACAQVGPPAVPPQAFALPEAPASVAPPAWTWGGAAVAELVARAEARQPDAQVAQARLAQALAVIDAQRADERPKIGLNAGLDRQKLARRPPGSPEPPDGPSQLTRRSLELQGGWTLDPFGRQAAMRAALQAQAEAAKRDAAQARMQLRAAVREQALQLAATAASAELLAAQTQVAEARWHLQQRLVEAGRADTRSLDAAAVELERAQRQQAESARQQRRQLAVLALLCGEAPAGFRAPALNPGLLDEEPPRWPDLPAQALAARPDVQAAWQRWWAATHEVDRARLDRFPQLRLTGNGGFVSDSFRQWLRSDSAGWLLGLQFSTPLLDGGRIAAAVAERRARADEAGAAYRRSVLGVLQQLADQLEAQAQAREALAQVEAELLRAERGVARARQRIQAGVADRSEQLAAEQQALLLHQQRRTAQQDLLLASLRAQQLLLGDRA